MATVSKSQKINNQLKRELLADFKMTSFSWKRKATKTITNATKAFDENEQVTEENADSEFDWISVAKRQRLDALEDNKALFERLKKEGVTLAEDDKFWQAINRWDVALCSDWLICFT